MRNAIPVYRAEIEAEIAAEVQAQASVAYTTDLVEVTEEGLKAALAAAAEPTPNVSEASLPFDGAVASLQDDVDLHYMQDILATVGWNNNDDIFTREEVWASRTSPDHKPLSFQHDKSNIIGHIVRTVPVDIDYRLLTAQAVEDLPDYFHLLNGTVVYRLAVPKTKEEEARAAFLDRTIAEIKAGIWKVSMECHFTNFDYGVIAPDSRQFIVPRDASTAWLTAHLRAYAPQDARRLTAMRADRHNPLLFSGTFIDASSGQQFKVGRVFRNLSFSGKGLVKNPGNPDSIIFQSVAAFMPAVYQQIEPSHESPSSDVTESVTMSEPNAELQAQVASLTRELEELRAKDVANVTSKLEASLATEKAAVTRVSEELASMTAQHESLKSTLAEVTKRAETAEASLAEANTSLKKIAVEKAHETRVKLVTDKGLEAAKATAFVDNLAALDDAAFASHVELLAPTWAKPATPPPPAKPSEKTVIDQATPEPDAALAAATDTDDASERQAKVGEYFSSLLKTCRHRS